MGIGAMYVAQEAQSKGLGQALLNACIDHAKSQTGVIQIDIAVTLGNDGARKLYRRNGFITWGIQADYLILNDGRHFDIEWMTLKL